MFHLTDSVLLLHGGAETEATTSIALSIAQPNGWLDIVESSTLNTRSEQTCIWRQVRPPHAAYPVALDGTDPPTETLVRSYGGTHYRGLDIRDLCSPHAHLRHGSANFSSGPSGISASLLDPPGDREYPFPTDRNDTGRETNTPLPCPVQTGMCLQSRSTFTLQTAVVRVMQGRTAIVPAAIIMSRCLGAEGAFPEGKEDRPYSSWASSSETLARRHKTNATADLSPCNGTSTILGQHEACPEHDDNERTRHVTTTSVRTLQPVCPHFLPLDLAHGAYDASFTYISDGVVLFWLVPSGFSQ